MTPYVDRLAAAGLDTVERAAVRSQLPTIERRVEQVAAVGLSTTLCHNDLHGNNVFDIDGELRFFDFGDALLMEPLAALTLPLPAALQLGRLGRVVIWVRCLAPMDDAELAEWGAPPASRWARCWSPRRWATSPGEARSGDASVAWRA